MKAKRSHAVLVVCAVAVLACTVSGWQLTRPDVAEKPPPDKLVGVFVTADRPVESRVYASQTSGDDGITTVVFPGLPNHFVAVVWVDEEIDGLQGYSLRSTGLGDVGESPGDSGSAFVGCPDSDSLPVGSPNDGTLVVEGTIYFVPSVFNLGAGFILNPIRESSDGTVYVAPGSGSDVQLVPSSSGSVSQSLTQQQSNTCDGKDYSGTMTALITATPVDDPGSITILQMSGDDRVLSTTEYAPGQVPKTIHPSSKTSYLIVETTVRGSQKVLRQSCNRDIDTYFYTMSCDDTGVCDKPMTNVYWA